MIALGTYQDRWSGDRFVVESTDGYVVYGRREFEGDGCFEKWSARIPNFRQCYVPMDREQAK